MMTDKSHFFVNETLNKNFQAKKILKGDNHLMARETETNKSII